MSFDDFMSNLVWGPQHKYKTKKQAMEAAAREKKEKITKPIRAVTGSCKKDGHEWGEWKTKGRLTTRRCIRVTCTMSQNK